MIQLLTRAAEENNENLGQWSLLTTTIVVRLQQPLNSNSEAVISKEEVLEAFLIYEDNQMTEQEMKIFCQLERFQYQRKVKHNSMRQTALNSSSNSFCCYICTTTVIKINQTPSNCQNQIQSWMFWFQDQYKKHSLQMFVQSQTIEDGDVSALNWNLLTVYFHVMKGEIVTQGRLLILPSREDRMPISASHSKIDRRQQKAQNQGGDCWALICWFRLSVYWADMYWTEELTWALGLVEFRLVRLGCS